MNAVIDEAASEPTSEAEEENDPTEPTDEADEWAPEEAGYGYGV